MKRKTLDKKLVKALAIGISASMALQPVTVFAEASEGEPNSEPQNEEEADTTTPVENAVSAEESNDSSLEEAKPDVAEAVEAGDNVKDFADKRETASEGKDQNHLQRPYMIMKIQIRL